MAIGDDDPIEVARRKNMGGYTLPAITNFSLPFWKRTRTQNTGNPLQDAMSGGELPMLNSQNYSRAIQNQVPIGGFGFGRGYGSQQMGIGDFLNQGGQQQSGFSQYQGQSQIHFLPPGFTAATGSTGLPNSSPNDLHFLPPGFTAIGGSTGLNGQASDQSGTLSPTQWTLPGVNAPANALADPSTGSLANANRYTSRGVPAQGAGTTYAPDIKAGYRVTESPTGQGMMIAGPARTKSTPIPKPNRLSGDYTGQTWQLGNWY